MSMSAIQQTFVVTKNTASTLKDHAHVDVRVVLMREVMEDVKVYVATVALNAKLCMYYHTARNF